MCYLHIRGLIGEYLCQLLISRLTGQLKTINDIAKRVPMSRAADSNYGYNVYRGDMVPDAQWKYSIIP